MSNQVEELIPVLQKAGYNELYIIKNSGVGAAKAIEVYVSKILLDDKLEDIQHVLEGYHMLIYKMPNSSSIIIRPHG